MQADEHGLALTDLFTEKGRQDLLEMRSGLVLAEFAYYCQLHPDARFWQALTNWSKQSFILALPNSSAIVDLPVLLAEIADEHNCKVLDTFHWEGRDG